MAFLVNQRAFDAGLQMWDQQKEEDRKMRAEARQAAADKRTEEEWGFKKADREKEQKRDAALQQAYEDGIKAARDSKPDTEKTGRWLGSMGGYMESQKPTPVEQTQPSNVIEGVGPTVVDVNPVAQVAQTGGFPAGGSGGFAAGAGGMAAAPPSQPMAAVDLERARAISSMKIAQLTNNPQAFSAAQSTLAALDKQAEYAAIVKGAANMTPEQRQRVVGTLNANPLYRFSGVVDPKTQITTLKYDEGGEVQLNPMQFGRVMVGKYKLDNGDLSGMADIEAVDAKLAERIAKDNEAIRGMVSTNNQAAATGATIELNRNQDRRAAAADGRAAAAEGRAAEEYRRKRQEEEERKGIGMALYMEKHPNATESELKAVGAGLVPVVPKLDSNAPAEVKLAQAYRAAGLASNDADALRMATQTKGHSQEQVRQDVFTKALAASMGDAAAAQKATEAAMAYLYPPVAAPATQPTGTQGIPKITSQADFAKLPRGAQYVAPDGSIRVRQ